MTLKNKLSDAALAIQDADSELATLRHQCANLQEIIDAVSGRSSGGPRHSLSTHELDGLQQIAYRINRTINRS